MKPGGPGLYLVLKPQGRELQAKWGPARTRQSRDCTQTRALSLIETKFARSNVRECSPQIHPKELISLRALGHEPHLFGEREHQVGSCFEIGLGMADEEM